MIAITFDVAEGRQDTGSRHPERPERATTLVESEQPNFAC